MSYEVLLARRARKALADLPRTEQQRVRAALDLLAETPRPPGCLPLQGEDDVFRVRVGRYRILYSIDDNRLLVSVIRIGHRRDVYR